MVAAPGGEVRAAAAPGGPVAGQGEEHVVEGRLAQGRVGGVDALGVQAAQRLGQGPRAVRRAQHDPAGVLVDGRVHAGAPQRRQRPLVVAGWHAQLDDGAADPVLELLAGALADQPAVVDDRDAVGQLVRLLQVLGGQQHGRPGADQVADQLPEVGADVDAGDAGAAGIWLQQGGEHADEGGLAGAVGAEQAVDAARRDGKGEAVQRADLAEDLDEPLGVDDGVVHGFLHQHLCTLGYTFGSHHASCILWCQQDRMEGTACRQAANARTCPRPRRQCGACAAPSAASRSSPPPPRRSPAPGSPPPAWTTSPRRPASAGRSSTGTSIQRPTCTARSSTAPVHGWPRPSACGTSPPTAWRRWWGSPPRTRPGSGCYSATPPGSRSSATRWTGSTPPWWPPPSASSPPGSPTAPGRGGPRSSPPRRRSRRSSRGWTPASPTASRPPNGSARPSTASSARPNRAGAARVHPAGLRSDCP